MKSRDFSRNGTQVIGKEVIIGGWFDADKKELRISFSKCAKTDKYDKAYGRAKAVGRAKGGIALITTYQVADPKTVGKDFKALADTILLNGSYNHINSKQLEAKIKESQKENK